MRRAIVLIVPLVLLAQASPALAAWRASGSGSGSGQASQMPSGNQPTATAQNRSVTVSWTASTIGGQNVGGYVVKRYDTNGNLQTIGSGCSGTITGLSCTETSVSQGTWRYTVTPKQAAWTGAESAQSDAVTVQSPSLSFTSSTTVTALPTTLSGNISNFVGGQTVAFKLDNPSTGTALTGSISPSPVPANGSATVSVTIPAGTANGSHTVYAIGSQGDTASAGITVNRPQVTSSVIAKSAGGDSGSIKQGGTYFVYANVSGSGSPPAGLSTLKANVSNITTGQTAATLTSGSYTVGGQSFNYRSAQLTANSSLTAGSKSYTLTLTDTAGTQTQSSYSVTVDNTAPTATDIQTTNVTGGTAGKAEFGDSITFTYSEPIDANSILSGWDGSSTGVTVVIADGGKSSDTATVWNGTTQLPLGTVSLGRTDYVTTGYVTFGASGTSSTMIRSGNTITITLGTAGTANGGLGTAAGTGTMTWTPSSTATDRAGNASSTTTATESGTADKDF